MVLVVGEDMVRAWVVDAERRDAVVKILNIMFLRCMIDDSWIGSATYGRCLGTLIPEGCPGIRKQNP